MKNREKRREEIIQACKKRTLCKDILKKFVLPSFGQTCSEDSPCNDTECDSCQFLAVLWLDEEYKEPEVDWSKVAVDTPLNNVTETPQFCPRMIGLKNQKDCNGLAWKNWKYCKDCWNQEVQE